MEGEGIAAAEPSTPVFCLALFLCQRLCTKFAYSQSSGSNFSIPDHFLKPRLYFILFFLCELYALCMHQKALASNTHLYN